MSPKARFQLVIEPAQLEALRELQHITGASIAEHIRRAVQQYIDRADIPKVIPVKRKAKK